MAVFSVGNKIKERTQNKHTSIKIKQLYSMMSPSAFSKVLENGSKGLLHLIRLNSNYLNGTSFFFLFRFLNFKANFSISRGGLVILPQSQMDQKAQKDEPILPCPNPRFHSIDLREYFQFIP